MRSSASARSGVGPRPESPGISSHVATHSASRSDQEVRMAYGGISRMRLLLRREQHPPYLPRLGEASGRFLEIQRTQDRMAEDAVGARLAHLLEAELTPEPQRLFEAERLGRAPRLGEKLRVDRHAARRPTSGRRIMQCVEAEYGE